jgi:NADH-quinone oxidoreductase subunit I
MWGTGFFKGMAVTIRNMFRGPITLQYPEQREQLPQRARWALRHKRDEAGEPKCTACLICVNACPDGIITLESHKTDDGGKHIDFYDYEVGACMFCGLCVEACPFDAIEMGDEYELATRDTACLRRRLLEDVPAAGRKAKPAEAKPEAAGPKPETAGEPKPEAAPEPKAAEPAPDSEPAEGGEPDA